MSIASHSGPGPGRGAGRRWAAFALVVVSMALGGGSLLLFVVFLASGPLGWVHLGLGDPAALALGAALCLAFFAQHSFMTRTAFRHWLGRWLHGDYHAAVYSMASGAVLLALLLLWQETSWDLFHVRGLPRLVLRVVFGASLAGFFWGSAALGELDAFGVRLVLRHLEGKEPTPRFSERGPYRWVRHPLYFVTLLLIWACPDVTADRLLFNGMFTLWIVVGTLLEERDLRTTFGGQYREYQRRVPMLIPYRLPGSEPRRG